MLSVKYVSKKSLAVSRRSTGVKENTTNLQRLLQKVSSIINYQDPFEQVEPFRIVSFSKLKTLA